MVTTATQWNKADVEACLERVLASPVFARAERQKRLLSYLVRETLGGRPGQLKGYTIGVEVFDRPADFDPAIDAIVRVQAGYLRAKLREYYDHEGRGDPLRIDLPKGAYAVRIDSREPEPDGAPAGKDRASPQTTRAQQQEDSASTQPVENKLSIAVLPFTNMSADPEQEYFADGITEDLITDLSKLSGLFVIARHSAFVYKGVAKRVQEIGQELGVRYLLEGSVRRAADRIRISAPLVDSDTGNHLWAERYDRDLSEIFALQDEVTYSIIDALQLHLTGEDKQRLAQTGTESVEAYELCRRGTASYLLWTPDALDWAEDLYERSMSIDPSYAEPCARLARVHTYRWLIGVRSRAESLDRALDLARRAVQLHDELPLTWGILSWACNWSGLHAESVPAARRAATLDPGGAETHYWLGVSLSCSGSQAEADLELAQALRLNPHCPPYYLWARAQNYLFMRRYPEAIGLAERLVREAPTFAGGYVVLTAGYALTGRIDEARRIGTEMTRLLPQFRQYGDAISIGCGKALGDLYREGFRLAGVRDR